MGRPHGVGNIRTPVSHPLPIAHSLVMECGRPVLVVPATVERSAFDSIAIGWDGSHEAVRAVHDALPLLRLSRSVQLVMVVHPSVEEDDADAKSLATHLAHHGVGVGETTLRIRTTDEHEALRQEIDQGQYDLLVMGGYSHAVWLEFIFGGATQSLLLSAKIPILISH